MMSLHILVIYCDAYLIIIFVLDITNWNIRFQGFSYKTVVSSHVDSSFALWSHMLLITKTNLVSSNVFVFEGPADKFIYFRSRSDLNSSVITQLIHHINIYLTFPTNNITTSKLNIFSLSFNLQFVYTIKVTSETISIVFNDTSKSSLDANRNSPNRRNLEFCLIFTADSAVLTKLIQTRMKTAFASGFLTFFTWIRSRNSCHRWNAIGMKGFGNFQIIVSTNMKSR